MLSLLIKIPNKATNPRPPAIVVQFRNVNISGQWKEKKKTGLISNNIVGGTNTDNIYINENLCPALKELYWNARVRGKRCNYKFVWVKNGQVFMRKSEGAAVLMVNGLDDLPRMEELEKAPGSGAGGGGGGAGVGAGISLNGASTSTY